MHESAGGKNPPALFSDEFHSEPHFLKASFTDLEKHGWLPARLHANGVTDL